MIARAKTASIRYYRVIMRKNSNIPSSAAQAKAPRVARGPAPLRDSKLNPNPQFNPNLNQQTRKVLAQHYRAKYGVK